MLLCSVLGVITLLWLARLPFHKPGVVLIGYGWSCIRGVFVVFACSLPGWLLVVCLGVSDWCVHCVASAVT